uniref:N-acetylneuraminate lyase n=1 Tax=Fundulus heteroclitus TaxID=8078 RepID=A0A3Q2Q733_FUNHE
MAPAVDGKLTGLLAATFTPFTAPLISIYSLDYPLCVNKTCLVSFPVNGTTGESMSLSVAERKVLAEEWCLRLCFRPQARHAVEIGADGIAVISPSFFKPKTAEALRQFLQEVARAAPSLPFYYYQIPSFTGVNENIEELIPSFRGVKFSGSDLLDFGQCVSYSQPHWSVLYGVDEQLLAALAMGANGAVGSTYNYMGCYVNQLISAFETGDLVKARTIQFKIQEVLGFDVGVNKQLMTEVSGLFLGPPRLPVMPCPPAHAQLTGLSSVS